MKNNLVFTGLRETASEEAEAKLRDFLRCELNIDYYIEFGNVGYTFLIVYEKSIPYKFYPFSSVFCLFHYRIQRPSTIEEQPGIHRIKGNRK
jgi:hypothetical protein